MLRCLSWQLEKLLRRPEGLSYVWFAEDASGDRNVLETDCEKFDAEDADAVVMLKAEMRREFQELGIVGYALAFPAQSYQVTRQSILHLDGERASVSVVCLEAHMGGVHLRAERRLFDDGTLGALTVPEAVPGHFGNLC
jgi:hypothetical protein